MSAEERLYSLAAQLKTLEAYLNELIARESTILRFISDARLVMDAISGLASVGDDVYALLPLGIGVYVHAKVSTKDKLLVSIGSDVAIEKSKDDAISYIENRVKELENALVALNNQKQEIQMRIEGTRSEMNSILRSVQNKGQNG